MAEESKIKLKNFFGEQSPGWEEDSQASQKGGQLLDDVGNAAEGRETMDAIVNFMMNEMKAYYGITNTVAGAVGDFESGFSMQTQEELNAENNAKLPLGLTMTQDGQNIDFGKWVGDKARMVGELGSDPIFADRLKEKGKEFGFDNLTPEKWKEISDQQGDNIQQAINYNIPGTDSHDMRIAAEGIDTSNPNKKKSNFSLIPDPERREKGGEIRSGQPYLVGEKGPEMIIPNSSGQVITNNNLKSIQREHNIAQLNRSMARKKLVIQPIVSNNTHTKVVNRTVRSR